MNCNQCGNPVETGDKFCPICGNQVDFSANVQPHETSDDVFSGDSVNNRSHLNQSQEITPVRIPEKVCEAPCSTPVTLVETASEEPFDLPPAPQKENSPVLNGEQPKETQEAPLAEEKPKKKKRKGLWITLTILLSVLVILGAGIGYFGYSAFTVHNRFNDKNYQVAIDHYNAKIKGSSLRQGILEVLFLGRPESIAKDCENKDLEYTAGIEQLKTLVAMNINDAQTELDNILPEYINHVVKQGEENNKNEQYEATLLAVKTARAIVPEGTNTEKLTKLFDETLPLYQEQVSKQVLTFVDKEQFDKAFELITHALEVDDNEYFQNLKDDTVKKYVVHITKIVTKQISKMQFDEALDTITGAVELFPKSQELLDLYQNVLDVINSLQ